MAFPGRHPCFYQAVVALVAALILASCNFIWEEPELGLAVTATNETGKDPPPPTVVEDERARHLDLAHRQLPEVAGGAIGRGVGVGITRVQRSKKSWTSAGPRRSQVAWRAAGSAAGEAIGQLSTKR